MNGMYTEVLVKRKMTPDLVAAKIASVAFTVMVLLAGIMFGQGIVVFVGVALGVACFYLLPMLKIDYEYIFCDGQIDFDRINAGERRKHVLRVDMDNIEIIAPVGSHELDGYRSQNDLKKYKFTSREDNSKVYALFSANGAQKMWVEFEPNDKMIEFAKQKSPRKVITY